MTIETQLKISSDPMLIRFIREYPIWYKYLNRNPDLFNNMVQDMKEKYKLTTSDRINNALKANYIFTSGVEYMVQDGEVVIIDSFTGRVLKGRQYSEGLHQALEAKEGVEIKQETVTVATITYQNFFRMYKKLSGMTGTAKTEEEEFRNIYNMYVVEVLPVSYTHLTLPTT